MVSRKRVVADWGTAHPQRQPVFCRLVTGTPKEEKMTKKRITQIIVGTLLIVAMLTTATPAAQAQQTTTYDYAWAKKTASLSYADAIAAINDAWATRTGDQWRSEGGPGNYDVPANTLVIGSMVAGNHPSFENLGTNIWYTSAGGRFGTEEGFRAFQLDGNRVITVTQPKTVAEMLAIVNAETVYGRKIEQLDKAWSSGPAINRWGSSAWMELLTSEQQDLLKASNQRPPALKQLLPGNTIVWGELAPGGQHWGLRRISENIYVTTGQGGLFVTDRGFRAMQFPR